MNKTQLVLRHELVTTMGRRSFIFASFGIPLIGLLLFVGLSALNRSSPGILSSLTGPRDAPEGRIYGYVDQAGLIDAVPEDVAEALIEYGDEDAALAALGSEDVSGYYLIPEDYVESGELVYVDPEASPFGKQRQDWIVRWAILVNMLDGDTDLAGRVWNPMDLRETPLSPSGNADRDSPFARLVPMLSVILIYLAILMSSGLLFTSVRNERRNRVLEIMLLSVDPQQMLAGKIIGLGVAGLMGTGAWGGAIYVAMRMSGGISDLPSGTQIPASVLVWGAAFFLLGFALYASLMAGTGALVQRTQEDSQARWLASMPVVVAYLLSFVTLSGDPHGVVGTVISLFPLTAPVAMVPRLVVGGVPAWQPWVAAALTLVTVPLIVRGVARVFRAQVLLAGEPFSAKRFMAALVGR